MNNIIFHQSRKFTSEIDKLKNRALENDFSEKFISNNTKKDNNLI